MTGDRAIQGNSAVFANGPALGPAGAGLARQRGRVSEPFALGMLVPQGPGKQRDRGDGSSIPETAGLLELLACRGSARCDTTPLRWSPPAAVQLRTLTRWY